MAEKNKKENGAMSIFAKDYKYEGLILLFIALVAIVLGTMVIIGETSGGTKGLVVNEGVFLIGDYPKAFAWILIILGAVSVLLAVWPYYKPSIYEFKRIAWPSKGTILRDTLIVLAFTIVMALFFIFSDWILNYFVKLMEWLAGKIN